MKLIFKIFYMGLQQQIFIVSDNFEEKEKSQLWNKSSKVSTFTTLNKDSNDLKKRWKNENAFNTTNKSTLSLRIAACKNPITSDIFGNENIAGLKKAKIGSIQKRCFTDSLKSRNPFEFPRQQNGNQRNKPEVMQFKASQQVIGSTEHQQRAAAAEGDIQREPESNNKRLWTTQSFYNAAYFVDNNYQLMTAAELVAVTLHSTVHKSYSKIFGRFVAIKIIDKKSIPSFLVEKFLPRELEVTKRVNHPHIVKCLHIAQPHPTKVVIISEFCDGGTLLKYVLDNNGLAEKEAARLFRQLIAAVYHLHYELSVAHRDIKLENILLDSNKVLKLADFGFARQTYKSEKSTSYCGTRPYSSPQLVSHTPYQPFAADWFASGIALYTMIAGFWPHEPWEKIRYPVKFTEKISYPARQLIEKLIEKDENNRADFAECMKSVWLINHTSDGKWIVPHDRKKKELKSNSFNSFFKRTLSQK